MQEPQEMQVGSLGWEDPLEEGMATHSSILAWRILMDRGACVLQSMEMQIVELDLATEQQNFTFQVPNPTYDELVKNLGWFNS